MPEMTCEFYLDRVIEIDFPIPAQQSLCMNSPYQDIEVLHEDCGTGKCPNFKEAK